MKYFLDTNVVSALMAGNAAAVGRLDRAGRQAVVLPQPVIAETLYGIGRLAPSRRRTLLAEHFAELRRSVAEAAWTAAVSEHFAQAKTELEKAGERIEDFDLAIAAHALAEGAILVTSNTKHLGRIRALRVEDWSVPE